MEKNLDKIIIIQILLIITQQYSIVDASQGQVLLAVYKDGTTADLYISDEEGIDYSLSLRNIITNNVQWNSNIESFHFYSVSCIKHTYVATYTFFDHYLLLGLFSTRHFFIMTLFIYVASVFLEVYDLYVPDILPCIMCIVER